MKALFQSLIAHRDAIELSSALDSMMSPLIVRGCRHPLSLRFVRWQQSRDRAARSTKY